jgi:hypothetical protein
VAALWGFIQGFRIVRTMMEPPPSVREDPVADRLDPMGAPARRASLPRSVPWPKYPGARQIHVGAAQTLQDNTIVQVLESSASADRIMAWYRRQLTRRGWTTNMTGKDPIEGSLAAPASALQDNPAFFQQERILRMIDDLHHKVLIMRKNRELLIIAAQPAQNARRQEIRLVWYDIDRTPATTGSAYADQYLTTGMPFRQEYGDDELVSRAIASPLPPDAYLAQWRTRLREDGWEETVVDESLTGHSRAPGVRAVMFTRGEEGTLIALQSGPDNGSLGLLTRITRTR